MMIYCVPLILKSTKIIPFMSSSRDNFSRFLTLREKYPLFVFESYDYYFDNNGLNLKFIFRIAEDIVFTPSIRVPWKKNIFRDRKDLSEEVLDHLVFQIGLAEMISYWKSTCSVNVAFPGKKMTSLCTDFWRKLYFNGLGEFLYTNGITTDIHSFMNIPDHGFQEPNPFSLDLAGPPLVPVGGGKDSALTLGLLEATGREFIPFAINPVRAAREVISLTGKSERDTILIERKIDPLLLKMNDEGFLNGHTPFSSVVAFYGLLAAYLAGSSEIILSNESSANEATVPGTNINHQYSKTYEFEKDFREYVARCISPDFEYFSLLRPLTELQIASLFSSRSKFFKAFRSCNVGSKTGSWCGKCPKCLFTWIILSPFLSQEKLSGIFGSNLMENPELKETLDELCGISAIKPFECIGTVDEVNEALAYMARHFKGSDMPYLLRYYVSAAKPLKYTESSFHARLKAFNPDHSVPEKYIELIKKTRHD